MLRCFSNTSPRAAEQAPLYVRKSLHVGVPVSRSHEGCEFISISGSVMASLVRNICFAALSGFLFASCSDVTSNDSQLKNEPAKPQAVLSVKIDERCLRTIRSHVEKTRGLSYGSYNIVEEESPDGEGFSVRHEDDMKAFLPEGGLKSFHIDLDEPCQKVIRELAYQ